MKMVILHQNILNGETVFAKKKLSKKYLRYPNKMLNCEHSDTDRLKPETFKKPSAKKLSKKASKVKNKSINEEDKSSYKYSKKGC